MRVISISLVLLVGLCTCDPIPDGECISEYPIFSPEVQESVQEAQLKIEDYLEKGFALAHKKRVQQIKALKRYGHRHRIVSHFGNVVKRPDSKTAQLSSCQGLGLLETSRYIAESQNWTTQEASLALQSVTIPQKLIGNLLKDCAGSSFGTSIDFHSNEEKSGDCLKDKYRSYDGTCNNPNHFKWGAALEPFQRYINPEYADGIGKLREAKNPNARLPNTRRVSLYLKNRPTPPKSATVTQTVKVWGQFIDHDIVKTPESSAGIDKNGEPIDIPCCEKGKYSKSPFEDCDPIIVPKGDSFYHNQSIDCLRFIRSSPFSGTSFLQSREQLSEITAFLDGSNVYGSSFEKTSELRKFSHGLLISSHESETGCTRTCPLYFLPDNPKPDPDNKYVAGDGRVNEQPSLTSMHTIWFRFHNKIASLLEAEMNMNDESNFQETRRIVIAVMQHITYTEFLPVVLGKNYLKYHGLSTPNKDFQDSAGYNTRYEIERNPTIFNAFGAAAFRFGHTLVSDDMNAKKPFKLSHNFFRAEMQENPDTYPSHILEGEFLSAAEGIDAFLDSTLTNKLLAEEPFSHGNDLMALNLLRGRDHGLPGYNKWRSFCNLRPFRSFYEMRSELDPIVVDKFEALYDDVDDVDLFPAGLAETVTADGILGPTFSCLIMKQFKNLKYGDRFWYENGPSIQTFNRKAAFTPRQLEAIRSTSLALVLCQGTNLEYTPLRPMEVSGCSTEDGNPIISCDDLETGGLIELLENNEWRD